MERARALAALGENNVIVARLQAQQARLLLCLVNERFSPMEPLPPTGNDMDTHAAVEQALELLLAAVTAIHHRRAAGTLLRGACRAAEVAHALAVLSDAYAAGELRAEDVPMGRAAEVGEVATVYVGTATLSALSVCLQPAAWTMLSDTHLDSSTSFGVFAMCVRETLDLVAALPSDETTAAIIDFVQRCEYAIGTLLEHVCAHSRDMMAAGFPATEAHAGSIIVEQVKPLCDAWAAQRCTPALQRLLALSSDEIFAQTMAVDESQCRSYVEGQRKRCCAHCGATEAVRGDFQACARGRRAFYCSREHQRAHWRAEHKAACRDVANRDVANSSQAAE